MEVNIRKTHRLQTLAYHGPSSPHSFIFICQAEALARYDLRQHLGAWAPGSIVVELDYVTDGAACTVLTAEQHIDRDRPLMIANSDQYVDIAIEDYLTRWTAPSWTD